MKPLLPANGIDSAIIGETEVVLIRRIGAGSGGEVYIGRWRGKKVAVKRMITSDENSVADFMAESALMSKLRHPNIVQFLAATVKPPHLYIVLELCKNGDLRDLLLKKRDVDLPHSLRMRMLKDISQGMLYLHSHKPLIIHRDLKSSNCMLTSNFEVKVRVCVRICIRIRIRIRIRICICICIRIRIRIRIR